ncbi:MAG: Rrf2 family transcriptional regulator [Clostridiales bacterium]|nr:Rrf2 family transcriptional regulator [Clostridiales bacterium]
MKISTKCSVALHCLIFIAEYENQVKVTSEMLSKSTGCNAAAIRSILNLLQKADLIYVLRGVGGAHLNRKPQDITIWSVYNALEPDGLEHLIGCHPNPYEKCPVGQNIRDVLKQPYEEIGLSVQKTMQTITLEQLLETYTNLIKD